MSPIPVCPVGLHIHVTFPKMITPDIWSLSHFFPALKPPTAHLRASAEHKTLSTSCLLHSDRKQPETGLFTAVIQFILQGAREAPRVRA